MSVDKKNQEMEFSDKELTTTRPTTLVLATTTSGLDNIRYLNADDINMTPSPLENRPLFFKPGSVIDSEVYARISASVLGQPAAAAEAPLTQDQHVKTMPEEHGYENKKDNNILIPRSHDELAELSQFMVKERPMHDEYADAILERLNLITNPTSMINTSRDDDIGEQQLTSSIISTHPYPPIYQVGTVLDHDRPFAEYGHLDAITIAKECGFYNILESMKSAIPNQEPPPPKRFSTKTYAISSWTAVSREEVMTAIKKEFGVTRLQYACVAQEIGDISGKHHLHMQIILKEKLSRKRWFLDKVTGVHCHYEVTTNDVAWNEYIKKKLNYIEFGSYKSTTVRNQIEYPSQAPPITTAGMALPQSVPPLPATIPTSRPVTTVRAFADSRLQEKRAIITQAMNFAETDINRAMDLMQKFLPGEFGPRRKWYLKTFTYIFEREQIEKAAEQRRLTQKEFTWPDSFPDCTQALHDTVQQWFRHHFYRRSRAKCLILIGPTGTGKTEFAKSLPGQYNYFIGQWRLKSWTDKADYLIFDDIPWDDYEKRRFPDKKRLLTQNGETNADDKYAETETINIKQPAIVLLNPGKDAGLLGREPKTDMERAELAYWNKRATIYRMGPEEYFLKPNQHQSGAISQASSTSTILPPTESVDDVDSLIDLIHSQN